MILLLVLSSFSEIGLILKSILTEGIYLLVKLDEFLVEDFWLVEFSELKLL
jgi:hypothetical protein